MSSIIEYQESLYSENIKRGRALEYLTIGWNSIEAMVAVGAGVAAGSASLIGFGIDSVIENSSAVTLLWRLRGDNDERSQQREKFALKLVGISFLLLAAYVAFDAGKSLIAFEPPEVSYVGITIAFLSLIVMPILARAKRRVAANINSSALNADSRQTDICAYLSAILLAGLGLNALFGWWWADSAAALIMIPIIAKEGVQALRGETCDDCHC